VLEGRWRVESLLGRGGMGRVYRGVHVALGRPAAIKLLAPGLAELPDMVARFRREALATSRLAHPHVVAVLDAGVHQGRPFLVMELVEGEPLDVLLSRSGPLPVERVLRLALPVAHALGTAHRAGIVHRDVKPANLLVTDAGLGEHPKVTDFGIALAEDLAGGGHTAAGVVVGTPEYMAPEQVLGGRVDARADVYALGVTLYQLLAGALPITGASPLATARAHLHQAPAPLSELRPDVPPALEALVMAMLAKEPSERPADGLAVADALRALSHAPALSMPPETTVAVLAGALSPSAAGAPAVLEAEVAREGGRLAQAVGVDLVALMPSAEGAVRLGRRMAAEVARWGARLVLHSGPASITPAGTAMGEAVRVAHALAQVGMPGEVLVTRATHDALGLGLRTFLAPRGQLRVRGSGPTLAVFQLGAGEPLAPDEVPCRGEGNLLRFTCVCGRPGAVEPPSHAWSALGVRCGGCSRPLRLLPDVGGAPGTPPPLRPSALLGQSLEENTAPEGERALDGALLDALSQLD
jgi:class 3 adenylate cyclase